MLSVEIGVIDVLPSEKVLMSVNESKFRHFDELSVIYELIVIDCTHLSSIWVQ